MAHVTEFALAAVNICPVAQGPERTTLVPPLPLNATVDAVIGASAELSPRRTCKVVPERTSAGNALVAPPNLRLGVPPVNVIPPGCDTLRESPVSVLSPSSPEFALLRQFIRSVLQSRRNPVLADGEQFDVSAVKLTVPLNVTVPENVGLPVNVPLSDPPVDTETEVADSVCVPEL